jgi:putative endonuclease
MKNPRKDSEQGAERALRRRAFHRGLASELWALAFLMLKGFRPLAWRRRTAAGEIDLICRRGRLIIFVEVKARADLAMAAEILTSQARARLARAAEAYLAASRSDPWTNIRLDAICVGRYGRLRHIRNI